ncbi:MAG: FAD-dependent oxidoreductase [Rhodospirillales bacterium]|jgi:glycine/D-amino acid oxidase-like deaminating enzyme|nr:FAD-dependent oxidoreductase [Rhodospirillales bacterium]
MDTDVLIGGGGIVGCSLAYFLAREGTDTLVIDRFDLNTQASGTNAGSLHVQMMSFFAMEGDWERYARLEAKLPLYLAGGRMWRELERELGFEVEVKSGGGLMVAETDDQLRFLEKKVAGERRLGLTSGVVTGAELKNLAPYLSDAVIGADFCPDEGKVNPLIATPAIARAAANADAVFRRGTALLGLTREKQGFAATTSGGPIRCRRVANAAGPDMGAVAAMVGLAYPTESLVLHMNATEPAAPFLPHLVQHANERLTLKQVANGNLLVGGGWPAVVDPATGQPSVVRTSVEGNLWVAQHLVPEMAHLRLIRTWAGVMEFSDVVNPIYGEAPEVPGFFNAQASAGYTAGPFCAHVLADVMGGRNEDGDAVRIALAQNAD